MRMIRGRSNLRWLPSRFNFALFRLLAAVRLLRSKPEPANVILVVDRHQSAIEYMSVAAWVVGTLTCFLAVTLFAALPLAPALLLALPVSALALELPTHLFALVLSAAGRDRDRLGAQSAMLMFLMFSFALWMASRPTWIRWVALQFLLLVVLNGVAASIVFLLRHPIARLEEGVGGLPSEL